MVGADPPLSSCRVACLGASLTEGTVSANFVKLLQEDPTLSRFTFINYGRNGDLLWNGLQRLDELLAGKPQIVTILMGTNDVNATLSERNRLRYVEFNHLPITHPDLDWFRENLSLIIGRIRNESQARIALLSLPMIGEDLQHVANQRISLYNQVISEMALRQGATFLDLHSVMVKYLRDHEEDRAELVPMTPYQDGLSSIGLATALRNRGLSWNEISRRQGFLLLTDGLHLNDTAAGLVAQILAQWLHGLP